LAALGIGALVLVVGGALNLLLGGLDVPLG